MNLKLGVDYNQFFLVINPIFNLLKLKSKPPPIWIVVPKIKIDAFINKREQMTKTIFLNNSLLSLNIFKIEGILDTKR